MTQITQTQTAADPYPVYAAWRAKGPMVQDPDSGLTVATTADAIRAVITDPDCTTRPRDQPVPANIAGTDAGAIFGRLVRMTDTPTAALAKQALIRAFGTVNADDLRLLAQARTRSAIQAAGGQVHPGELAFSVPVEVIAAQLGFEPARLAVIREHISNFVYCISPLSTPAQIDLAQNASTSLIAETNAVLESSAETLSSKMKHEMAPVMRMDPMVLLANLVGTMSQTFDATAGLIGQSLVCMSRHRGPWDDHKMPDAAVLQAVATETARYDAPIQNTRRFRPDGTAVLLLLGSANRDPSANPDPDRFDINRYGPICYTFSLHVHQCPGAAFALAITTGVLAGCLEAGFIPQSHVPDSIEYMRSANARIPVLPVVSPHGPVARIL